MNYTPSAVLGEVIIDQMIKSGVRDVVISPGSRNAPLTMSLWRAAEKKRISLHTRIDERSAAFLALGIAKATKVPTPVICTSGSAAANFYPALLEAHHSDIPLIAVTADRPKRLWKTGANQTTTQVGMFPAAFDSTINIFARDMESGQVQSWRNTIAQVIGNSRPAHVNVEFDEPLLGPLDWVEPLNCEVEVSVSKPSERKALKKSSPYGVILVGHDSAGIPWQEIVNFSQSTGWPILSENPLLGEQVIAHSSLILTSEKRRAELKPEIAMVIGRLTLTRAMSAYLSLAEYQVVVDQRSEDIDTERKADEIHRTFPVVPTGFSIDKFWSTKFQVFSESISSQLSSIMLSWSEPSVAAAIAAELPHNATVFIASSRPIRDVEAFATPREGIESFANRGLAGIDGNISTAYGIALMRKNTFAILGDLSFLHDINGLLIGKDEKSANLTIIVISNDGGGIFSTLPQRDVPGFEKIFGTPHGRDLVSIAESYGIPAVAVRTLDALRAQLSRRTQGLNVIVAQMPDRNENAALLQKITDSLTLL